VAVVGTCDRNLSLHLWEQALGSSKEIIAKLIAKLLDKFRRKNGNTKAKRLIIFRQGTSERNAMAEYDELVRVLKDSPYHKTKITFIVVHKRLSTRFFLRQRNQRFSPWPGTYVSSRTDVSLTGPGRGLKEFYVVPSEAHPNVGTATPTKFMVIADTLEAPEKVLATFAHMLCFGYGNWAGSVRVPSVLQHASALCKMMNEFVRTTDVHPNLRGDGEDDALLMPFM